MSSSNQPNSGNGNTAVANGGPPANAASVAANNSNVINGFKMMLLTGMVLQNSSTVLVGRYTRSGVPADALYEVNHLIMVTEIGKLICATVLEYFHTNGNLYTSIHDNILKRPLDAMKILVPALLYLLQNTLLYVALSNLTAPIFQVTYQGKLVTTAIVSVIMLNRVYNRKQWICLVVLSLGVAIVVLGEKKGDDDDDKAAVEEKQDLPTQSLAVGLISVAIACLSSALAGVYFEKVLKKADSAAEQPVSMWMRNMQLAFFSIVIAFFQGLGKMNPEKSYLHGFTFWAWVLVGLQAGGGMLVAAVIKYADNVLKGLATGVSVVVATAVSTVLFGTPLHGQFALGASMILSSVYLFSNDVPFMNSSRKSHEMKPMLPK